jgi:hypothetical protein
MYKTFDLIMVQTIYLKERLCELGICAAYMPHSFEPCTPSPNAPQYDIVYQGNGYTEFRRELIQMLRALDYNVGLYGRCDTVQMDGETNYNYAEGQGIYKNSTIAVSTMQFDHHTGRGFVSNRLWEIMASGGAICLQQYVPMLEELTGLQDGVHMAYWHTFDELRTLIDYYMTNPIEAQRIAETAYTFVHNNHSFDHRIRKVFVEILPEDLNGKAIQTT